MASGVDLSGFKLGDNVTYQGLVDYLKCNGIDIPGAVSVDLVEQRFTIPTQAFAVPGLPTDAEVISYAVANISLGDRRNGVILVYILNGTTDDPDWVWVYDQEGAVPANQILTRLKSPTSVVTEQLSRVIPQSAFADAYRPTTPEAEAYAVANYALTERRNGLVMTYTIPTGIGDNHFVWTGDVNGASQGNQLLNLSHESAKHETTLFLNPRGNDARAEEGNALRPFSTIAGAIADHTGFLSETFHFMSGVYNVIEVGGLHTNDLREGYNEVSDVDSINMWRARHFNAYFTPGTTFILKNNITAVRLFSNSVNESQANATESIIGGAIIFKTGGDTNDGDGGFIMFWNGLTSSGLNGRFLIGKIFLVDVTTPWLALRGTGMFQFEDIFISESGPIQFWLHDTAANSYAACSFKITARFYSIPLNVYQDPMFYFTGASSFNSTKCKIYMEGAYNTGHHQPIYFLDNRTSADSELDFYLRGHLAETGFTEDTPVYTGSDPYLGVGNKQDAAIIIDGGTHTQYLAKIVFEQFAFGTNQTAQTRLVSIHGATFVDSYIDIVFNNVRHLQEHMVYLENITLNNSIISIRFNNSIVDVQAALMVTLGLTLSNGGKVIVSGYLKQRHATVAAIRTEHGIHLQDMTIITGGGDEVENNSGGPLNYVIHGTLRTNELVAPTNVTYIGGTVDRLAAYE